MSQTDKAREATLRMLSKPAAAAPAAAPAAPAITTPSSGLSPMPARQEPEMVFVRKTVANSSARTMVYLPQSWKDKFREIAYHERRKENDLSLEAFRDFLTKKGHTVPDA